MSALLETVQGREQDREIPTLSVVLDRLRLTKCLAPIISATWEDLRDVSVNVLDYHRGQRCTVDITLKTTTGRHELIGKVYSKDRPDVYRAMMQISRSGFGPEADFSVPNPLTYVSELQLLLQEKVTGPLATEVFLKGNSKSRALASERCARWLANFQGIALQAERVSDLRRESLSRERLVREISAADHSLVDRAHELSKQLETAARGDGIEPCAGHGSYSHRQIILAESRTVTFDWDGYCLAHPCRDVARFIVALRRLALGRLGSIRALDAFAAIFQQTYIALTKPGSTKQLAAYEAAICLELAARKLRKGRRMKSEALINEGLRILQQQG